MKPEQFVEKMLESEHDHTLADLVDGWVNGLFDAESVIENLRQLGFITGDDLAKYGDDGIEVEPGSREHGVIHVFFTNGDSQEILTIGSDGTSERIINK